MTSKCHLGALLTIAAVFCLMAGAFDCTAQYLGGSIPILSTFDELSQIAVSDPNRIISVQVTLIGLSHGRSGDLHIILEHTTTNNITTDVDLFSRPGVTTAIPFGATSTTSGNYGFSDRTTNTFSAAAIAAGGGVVPNDIYHPCAASPDYNYPLTYLSTLAGPAAAGAWRLIIGDSGPGIDGTLDGWQLDIITIPRLGINLPDANTTVVYWPAPSTGFFLQANSDLNTTNWVDVTNAVGFVNGTNQVAISPLSAKQFFRMVYR